MAPLSRMIDSLLKRPLEMRETLRRRSEAHASADIIATRGAAVAFVAGHADFEGHAVAGGEATHGGAGLCYDAAGLVAEG